MIAKLGQINLELLLHYNFKNPVGLASVTICLVGAMSISEMASRVLKSLVELRTTPLSSEITARIKVSRVSCTGLPGHNTRVSGYSSLFSLPAFYLNGMVYHPVFA